MMIHAAHDNLLRTRGSAEDGRVTFVELFFELVFVFAVTQLSHGLLQYQTPAGLQHTALLLLAVWWAWIDTSWVTNWLDPQKTPVRLLLFALMLVGLVLSASIPEAFAERGLVFAAAYAVIQVGRSLFMLWALKNHSSTNFHNFQRIAAWHVLVALIWLAGGLAHGEARLALWIFALVVETAAPTVGFFVPGLGRSATADWDIAGSHMAERCGLFIIIALGESVLVTGATFSELAWDLSAFAAFVGALAGAVAMWWVYFNVGAEKASRLIAHSADPGRVGRLAYTYMHIVIVAGIIVVAVADELVLAHPSGHVARATTAAALGGPALYLLGNILFKRSVARWLPLSHLVGLAALAALVPAASHLTPLLLGAAASAVLVIVAIWETLSLKSYRAAPNRAEPVS
jgi:low temperature requirement protein LtrA